MFELFYSSHTKKALKMVPGCLSLLALFVFDILI